MPHFTVGILGATGIVGQRFIEMLVRHPWFEITALAASETRAGKKYGEQVDWRIGPAVPEEVYNMEMIRLDPEEIKADLVFSALPSDVAREVEPKFAEKGFIVASNASAYRMEEDVPLVIPEVNPDHLALIEIQREKRGWDGCIITNPNCSTIILTLTLKPLMQFGLKRVVVTTMQALSGAGFPGVPSMSILDNIIPYISGEEGKVENEPLKLLGELDGDHIRMADIDIMATCTRVNVMDGHLESVLALMESNPTVDDVKKAFKKFKALDLPTSPEELIILRDEMDRPQPRLDREEGKGMSVTVGRIREGIRYLVLGHNAIRGAAGASVLNMELAAKEKLI